MSHFETEIEREARIRASQSYASRVMHTNTGPSFEPRDIAAAALAAAMMLGPLTAYAVGFGG